MQESKMEQLWRSGHISGGNASYVEELYEQYLEDPSSLPDQWRSYFETLPMVEGTLAPDISHSTVRDHFLLLSKNQSRVTPVSPASINADYERKQVAVGELISGYRRRGHIRAVLDPLSMQELEHPPILELEYHRLSAADLDTKFQTGSLFFGDTEATLREIIDTLEQTYCGSIGAEYMHIEDQAEQLWVQQRMEGARSKPSFSNGVKRRILDRLIAAEGLEKYLGTKYPGTKRFGVEGGESFIPSLAEVIHRSGKAGVAETVIGMAHRGRINVLVNIMGKDPADLFDEFEGRYTPGFGSGDVKYHQGFSANLMTPGGEMHLALGFNPSHLEIVAPVIEGSVRARMDRRGDNEGDEVLAINIHGDAAFAGQGVVAECFGLSGLKGHRTGGSIHFIINNQIGFTTMPKFSRSGPYSTDVAKTLSSPIFHVNGDDPEAVVHVARIATEFRQKFKRDVVIDMFCYRRFGHNEGDEPAFTQPLMYKTIAKHKTAREIYSEQLVTEKVITAEEGQEMVDAFHAHLEEAFQATETYEPGDADFLEGAWEGMKVASGDARRGETAITDAQVQEIGKVLTNVPDDFVINKKLQRVLDAKTKMLESGEGFDWAMGEALAFGSLLKDGFAVRLSGQDVGRGTFSHRHAIWYDQEDEHKHVPLQHIAPEQPRFEAHDSPLSEMAVLGFEYGYSMADPKTLTLWEAQFGDFANGAQVMFDQFISSGESKWLRMSGLVMLLPHGYEGQGPEHSSARPERFLQNCAEDNWQICNCTTPANYFHALRRQMLRDFRKPLVIMTPKSLLRHKLAVSDASMFTEGSTFHRFLWDDDHDDLVKADKIKRIILCTGKVYYDLLAERRERKIKDVMILRVEQLYPFPKNALTEELKPYKNADVVWCQEEPENQGYWTFVDRRIEEVLEGADIKAKRPIYVGREAAAAPATGLMSRHKAQQEKLVDEALSV